MQGLPLPPSRRNFVSDSGQDVEEMNARLDRSTSSSMATADSGQDVEELNARGSACRPNSGSLA